VFLLDPTNLLLGVLNFDCDNIGMFTKPGTQYYDHVMGNIHKIKQSFVDKYLPNFGVEKIEFDPNEDSVEVLSEIESYYTRWVEIDGETYYTFNRERPHEIV